MLRVRQSKTHVCEYGMRGHLANQNHGDNPVVVDERGPSSELGPAMERPFAATPANEQKNGVMPEKRSKQRQQQAHPESEYHPSQRAEQESRHTAGDENRHREDCDRI